MTAPKCDGMNIPPASELIDFDTFASVMNAAPLDDIHKYFDSDDEQDLEDNYAGEEDEEADEFEMGGGDSNSENLGGQHFSQKKQKTSVCVDCTDDDSDSDDHEGVEDDGRAYDYFDPRLDINLSKLRPSHAASHFLDQELQKMIDETEVTLEQLSIQAQSIIDEQPLSTQVILANQAADQVFKKYAVHGSQARFSESVMKFLSGGDTVRRPGNDGRDKSKDGKLRLADAVSGTRDGMYGRDKYNKLKRKADEKAVISLGDRRLKIKVPKSQFGDDTGLAVKKQKAVDTKAIPSTPDLGGANVFGERVGFRSQSAGGICFNESLDSADSLSFRKTSGPWTGTGAEGDGMATSFDATTNLYLQDFENVDLKPRKTSSSVSMPQPQSIRPTSFDRIPFTPLAANFSEALHVRTPSRSSFSPPLKRQDTHAYSCTNDPKANAALAREDYNPVSLKLTWPASTRSSGQPCMPTPGLLDALNNIIHLTNAEGKFMLSYYVRKYDAPMHICGPDTGVAPPHALFRLGIAQYLNSKVGKVIDNKESDELGLNPEARRVLGEVWEKHPSVQAWFGNDLLDSNNWPVCSGYEGCANSEEDYVAECRKFQAEHTEDAKGSFAGRQETGDAGDKDHVHGKMQFKGGLNPLEKALLARGCNISIDTVDAYWESMREKTKAWGAMKAWCEVRSREKIARAKAEGRW